MPYYKIRKRLVSIGRDYAVEDENGQVLFKIDGKVRFARTFYIKNADGKQLLKVREKLLSIDLMYEIKRDDLLVAIVRRKSLSDAATSKFEIEIDGEVALKAHGSLLNDSIQIQRGSMKVSDLSRKHFTVIDEIFNVSVSSDEDQALVLAIAMSIVEATTFRGEHRSASEP